MHNTPLIKRKPQETGCFYKAIAFLATQSSRSKLREYIQKNLRPQPPR